MTTTMTRVENRPTVADYCANCGSTGACKRWRGIEGCVMHPRPLTLKIHEANERQATIKAMTSARRAEVLGILARLDPESFDFAVAANDYGRAL